MKLIKQVLPCLLSSLFIFCGATSMNGQVTLEQELLISDKGLYFDGDNVDQNSTNSDIGGTEYIYAFGRRIAPHGDCIKEYNGYIFMTWYKGGKYNRHVMLSRYNPNTGVVKDIEFPHTHTGFQNKWYIGESHNTIAVGICPLDGTIHMVYDLHAYFENRPADGSLADDYFRYSYSKKNVLTVPDNEFNLSQFVNDPDDEYKHLKMRPNSGGDYKELTYPNFFLNTQNELFMWIREGGNDNGAYKFCKYDGTSWSEFTQFNILNAKQGTTLNNWGLYGDIKFEAGKMRIGFQKRENKDDRYKYQNGFYYAYSDDPNGLNQWKDHTGSGFNLPLVDAERIKVSEPGDLVNNQAMNSVSMVSDFDWTVTERGDVHIIGLVKADGESDVKVHTYKKAGTNNFTTSTNFAGAEKIYTYNNEIYIIGLDNNRVFIEKADGGTNSFTRIYEVTSGKQFRHGNVYISNGKLYYYLMEIGSGSAQPIYLQIIDLDIDQEENQSPEVSLITPSNNQVFLLGEEITLSADASDSDGSIEKVNFKENGSFYARVNDEPYTTTFTPTEVGTYLIEAKAFDNDSAETVVSVNIFVTTPPTVSITSPSENEVFQLGEEITLSADASDSDGSIEKVNFKENGSFHARVDNEPYTTTFTPTEPGTYLIEAKAFDSLLVETVDSLYIIVNAPPTVTITSPLENEVFALGEEVTFSADASGVDDNITHVNFKVNTVFEKRVGSAPFIHSYTPTEIGTYVIAAKGFDENGASIEKDVTIEVAPVTGNKRNLKTDEIMVYPNPSEIGLFNLKEVSAWEVNDLQGKHVLKGESSKIDLSDYKRGVYILIINNRTIKLIY